MSLSTEVEEMLTELENYCVTVGNQMIRWNSQWDTSELFTPTATMAFRRGEKKGTAFSAIEISRAIDHVRLMGKRTELTPYDSDEAPFLIYRLLTERVIAEMDDRTVSPRSEPVSKLRQCEIVGIRSGMVTSLYVALAVISPWVKTASIGSVDFDPEIFHPASIASDFRLTITNAYIELFRKV